MSYHYCPKSNRFFADALKDNYVASGVWPESGIPLTDVEWRSLHANVPQGHQIVPGLDGQPVYAPTPPPTLADIAETNRFLVRARLDRIRPAFQELSDRVEEGLVNLEQQDRYQKLREYRRQLMRLDTTQPIEAWPVLDESWLT